MGDPLTQIGTDANWQELVPLKWAHCLARKTDGTTWTVNLQAASNSEGQRPQQATSDRYRHQPRVAGDSDVKIVPTLIRQADYDGAVLQTLANGRDAQAYIDHHGVLYYARGQFFNRGPSTLSEFHPISQETNWQSVTITWNWLVALKRDGSLWKWNLRPDPDLSDQDRSVFPAEKPTQLGTHSDWLGLAESFERPISLAADGSLWAWAGTDHYDFALMQPPRGPSRLGNIFDHQP